MPIPRRYDLKFTLEAVRMAAERGMTAKEVESRLGIRQGVSSRWKRELNKEGIQAFPGKGHLKPEGEELRQLKRECERLRRDLRGGLERAFSIPTDGSTFRYPPEFEVLIRYPNDG